MIAITTSNSMSVKARNIQQADLMRPADDAQSASGSKGSGHAEELLRAVRGVGAGD